MKLPGGYNQDAILLSLAETDAKSRQYMVFWQSMANSLSCYPFYTIYGNPDNVAKISYLDYDTA